MEPMPRRSTSLDIPATSSRIGARSITYPRARAAEVLQGQDLVAGQAVIAGRREDRRQDSPPPSLTIRWPQRGAAKMQFETSGYN